MPKFLERRNQRIAEEEAAFNRRQEQRRAEKQAQFNTRVEELGNLTPAQLREKALELVVRAEAAGYVETAGAYYSGATALANLAMLGLAMEDRTVEQSHDA